MKARPASFLLRALAGCLPLAVAALAGAAGAPQPLVVVGRIETPIHPAAASYLEKLIKGAEEDHAALVVLGLSTPGGLLTSTRVMASTILASKVPVVTYVSPSGASAASAGFFLLLAGDVAAMAPGTNTGAAHPVGGVEGQELPKTLNEKAEQDARAFIRTLARQRGRNADNAESAVISSKSFTETEAKAAGLVEFVARDVADLVEQLDGRTIRNVGGKQATLHLKGARLESRDMSGLEKLLGVVSHPNVAYLLFLLGLVGLYFEMSSPGAVLPGVVGGIALLLALYAFSVLPVNLAGIGLILFAILLFIAEVKAATHGVLAAGGAVSLIAGSLLLFSGHGDAGYRVDLSIILPGIALTLLVVAFLMWKTIQIRRTPVRTGASSLVGKTARVVRVAAETGGAGTVLVDGEYWDAYGAADVPQGETVRVRAVEGLKLRVERRT